MKTLFVAGLFPDRHATLFGRLCREFNVIAFRDCGFPRGDNFPYTAGEDLVGEVCDVTASELAWESGGLQQFAGRRLAGMLGRDVEIPREAFEESFESASRALRAADRFGRLSEAAPVDLVVTSADYDGNRRSVVLEARSRNIPTLCIEHGFWAEIPRRDVFKPDSRGYAAHASDWVNLDNDLEVEAAGDAHRTMHPDREGPGLVANGTPHDPVFDPALGRDEAVARLGLAPARSTVVVLGLWLEPRTPAQVFKAQIEAVEAYRQLFAAFAAWPGRGAVQVVIKLHPAFKAPEKFDEARRCLLRLAAEAGCAEPLITVSQLQEVLAASDVLVSFGVTSVFWDGFLYGRPSIVFPTPIYVERLESREALRSGNVLLERGIIRVAYSGDEVWSWVGHFNKPEHRAEFEDAVTAVKQEYGIEIVSSREKSERICAWIRERLG